MADASTDQMDVDMTRRHYQVCTIRRIKYFLMSRLPGLAQKQEFTVNDGHGSSDG